MTHLLAIHNDLRARPLPRKGFSAEVLMQLVLSHEEMISQLCVERAEAVNNGNFLTSMIDQHESAAALLRTRLKRLTAGRAVARVSPRVMR
jgi:hypothetical protein